MIGDDGKNPKANRNPAFAMLGLPQIKLPSKPWLAFWAVTSVLAGGILFDKYQQKQIRKQYQSWGEEQFGTKTMNVDELPRKVRVYIAPFPNDYLAEALKYFKRFVKPIMNSAGVDIKLVTMERQGDIRHAVAEEIRQMRRKAAGLPDVQEEEQQQQEETKEEKVEEVKEPIKMPHNAVFANIQAQRTVVEPVEETVSFHDLYKPMDIVSVKSLFDFSFKVKSQDELVDDVRQSGGVICVGRGAYKEYINGVNEGLLGPLYAPPVKEEQEVISDDLSEDQKKELEKKKKEDEEYAPAPYILAKDYPSCELSPELNLETLRDEEGKPYFFVQPILELRNYSVSGFTRQLERMWRFYHKREQQIEYNEGLKNVIEHKYEPMQGTVEIGIEEENDWPSRWKKDAIEKQSEWLRDFACDPRVEQLLSVYKK